MKEINKCPECQFERGHSQGCSKYEPQKFMKEPNKLEEIMEEFDEKFDKKYPSVRSYTAGHLQDFVKSFIKKVYHQGREDERKEIVEKIDRLKIEKEQYYRAWQKNDESSTARILHELDGCFSALTDLRDKLK